MNPVITGAIPGKLVPIAILVCAWFVASALMQNRTKREAERLELHVKLLERAGSARELGAFLSSPAGERFLRSLSLFRATCPAISRSSACFGVTVSRIVARRLGISIGQGHSYAR